MDFQLMGMLENGKGGRVCMRLVFLFSLSIISVFGAAPLAANFINTGECCITANAPVNCALVSPTPIPVELSLQLIVYVDLYL